MCGVVACSNFGLQSEKITKNFLKKIEHRGPDNSAFYFSENINLGSCRLSIMDLSPSANMPMNDKTGQYIIVYNGEIYNFKYLTKKYKISNYTNSDTEVVLELYSILKEKCLDELNGIFSFIIFDKKNNKLFCARDRLGIKPFYYYFDEFFFLASSEIKSFTQFNSKNLNFNTINNYLTTSFYDYGDKTFFNDIFQLEPGSYINYSLQDKKIEIKKYFFLKKSEFLYKGIDEKSLIRQGSDLILDSFKLQLQTDTSLSINVSSGLDSKLMLTCIDQINRGQGNIRANSFFFDHENFNEKQDLENFAQKKKWKINFFKILPEDIINNFDETLYMHDGPFPGLPTIGKSLLIKRSSDSSHKVVLEAQGGDDVAGGYKYIFGFYLRDLLKSKKYINFFQEFVSFSKVEGISLKEVFNLFHNSFRSLNVGGFSADGTKNVSKEILNKNLIYSDKSKKWSEDLKEIKNYLDKIIYRDIFYTKLPRILKSCDRASMMNGKELRVPLLDHRIVNFFYNLDNKYIINSGNLRYLYRKIASQIIGEDEAFIKKKYVTDPQTFWLKNELFDWAYSILSNQKTKYDGIFNTNILLKEFEEFKKNKFYDNSNFYWQAICLKRFQQIY
jgi:asparagine synthase (glutamine-hydrolysing)